jgi:hypothetical protein
VLHERALRRGYLRSFARTDEGLELSYELARYCVRALARDREPFV